MKGFLDKLPFNGYKTLLGWLLFEGSKMIPDPKAQAVAQAVGALLVALGLIHKAEKDKE